MLAEVKLAYQRLSILELAEALGNVSEACRQRGMGRKSFCEYKRRFEVAGLERLKIAKRLPAEKMNSPN